MNEQRLLLKGKRGELRQRYLELKARGSSIIKRLGIGLNLSIHDEIENLEMTEITNLTGELSGIQEEIKTINIKIKELTEEIGDGKLG